MDTDDETLELLESILAELRQGNAVGYQTSATDILTAVTNARVESKRDELSRDLAESERRMTAALAELADTTAELRTAIREQL